MRHTVLCLIVAFLAAVACFVLLPMIGLFLLRIFTRGVFADDSLVWISIFVGPPLLALLVGFSFLTGLVAFLISMARLRDRGWRSAQTSAILLTFAATIATAGAIAWPYYAEPLEAGPLQTGLPSLHLARTLKAAGNRSGTWRLSWSADSERLAAYSGAGIVTWSPDGKYQREIPVYRNSVTTDVLRYLSGHSLLITSPVAEVNSAEARDNLSDVAFSVLDAETGKVLRNIPGPHLGGGGPKNNATDLAVSPDERFVVVICGPAAPQTNVHSTAGWQHVATVDFRGGEKGGALDPRR